MRIGLSTIKYPIAAVFAACSLSYAAPAAAQTITGNQNVTDTFERVDSTSRNPVDKYTQEDLPEVFREEVNPSGWTNDPEILKNAPDPSFTLKWKKKQARGVVDITNCRFYVYDDNGKAIESFRVATGASRTPTKPGIRLIKKKQIYPYKDCAAGTKRRRFPRDYGPKIAFVHYVDTITGQTADRGDYFHGTRHEKAVLKANRHVTHSCVRVHNRDILYLVNDVFKIGDYLKYIR
ncbi:L,D-transpeptidase [bacterium]|nr:L,D-transpeptidase [bacterium]